MGRDGICRGGVRDGTMRSVSHFRSPSLGTLVVDPGPWRRSKRCARPTFFRSLYCLRRLLFFATSCIAASRATGSDIGVAPAS
jgi:hypothetical protein